MKGDSIISKGTPVRVAHGPSLKALVDVANSTAAPESTPAPKAKAKAKAKSRGVKQQAPKTPAEMKNSIRHLSIWENGH